MENEYDARIKINELLQQADWRFSDTTLGKRNVLEEKSISTDYKKRPDYKLLDDTGKEIAVLEAKRPQKSPLDGKEQARDYAQRLNARFVILSNGEEHYLWDIECGHPTSIYDFPSAYTLTYWKEFFQPHYRRLADEIVEEDYIIQSQQPHFKTDPKYLDPATRDEYLNENDLKLLRLYQVRAIHALQKNARNQQTRFLFEMATGTGKTLIAAAVIKLFLRTGNAKRVLFLVDRIELEHQARDGFKDYLKKDFHVVIYKENRKEWQNAEIVVTTVQSLVKERRYLAIFKPNDFDLVISDEAHRSINGEARKVFEYFIGFKLGLTATPKDYLKHAVANPNDPREWERRLLLDTYRIFGCNQGEPTFRYTLLDGVREKVLINPLAIDARTDITTQLLSEQGYAVILPDEAVEEAFTGRDFEKRLFNQATNESFCEVFLKNALRDPISGEIGKSLIFCVSQDHAQKIADILNKIASGRFPNQYQSSNFAMQVTSDIPGAAQFAADFKNDKLNCKSKFLEGYETSKTRVCVTVAMMTTGYDCPDLLNICFMRPIFSPTDFVQMKGRGTRKFTFNCKDGEKKGLTVKKERFHLFDFFANCEYFEEKFNYDQVLKLPKPTDKTGAAGAVGESGVFADDAEGINSGKIIILHQDDPLKSLQTTVIGSEGMKIDRQLFQQARQVIVADAEIKNAVAHRQWDDAVQAMRDKYEDKPNLFLTLDKIRRSEGLDRRITWREVLERVFGMTQADRFLTKLEKLEADIEPFFVHHAPDPALIPVIHDFMKLYLTDERFRSIINHRDFGKLHAYSGFSMENLKQLGRYRETIVEYIKTNISLNSYLD
jgi:type I restriction enzyme R subunit